MQATRLGEPAVALVRLPVPDQVLPEPEGDVRTRHVVGGPGRAGSGALGVEGVLARRT
jgi:hypothetical protein